MTHLLPWYGITFFPSFFALSQEWLEWADIWWSAGHLLSNTNSTRLHELVHNPERKWHGVKSKSDLFAINNVYYCSFSSEILMESFYNLGGRCHSMERTDHTFALLGRITVEAILIPYWDLVLAGKRALPQVTLAPVWLTSLTSHRHMFKDTHSHPYFKLLLCFHCSPPLILFLPTNIASVSSKPVKAVWLPAAHIVVQLPSHMKELSLLPLTQCSLAACIWHNTAFQQPAIPPWSSCWTKLRQSTWPDILLNIFIYKEKKVNSTKEKM